MCQICTVHSMLVMLVLSIYPLATPFEGKHVAGHVSLTVEHFTLLIKTVSSALFPIKIFPFRYFIGRVRT